MSSRTLELEWLLRIGLKSVYARELDLFAPKLSSVSCRLFYVLLEQQRVSYQYLQQHLQTRPQISCRLFSSPQLSLCVVCFSSVLQNYP
jgi:hypothetical protein